ncbi:MAG TPA: ATP-dependent sacrificial sulfur transferase LarE, partial [Bacillota bacterium]|nr:ATP-dependent sacrificial sulfur transferase LarE [Bacillota bacterium]
LIVEHDNLASPRFASNPPDRCYYCKKKGFAELFSIARTYGIKVVADGLNADDLRDYRPGRRAGEEMGVLSPLKEAGLTKIDIRSLSRRLNLPTAEKPANPCLATRFPYGTEITPEGLRRVKAAEEALLKMNIPLVRVRHHGNLARIEVPPECLAGIVENAGRLVSIFKEIGYVYVTLDLQGYRTGSMNEALER